MRRFTHITTCSSPHPLMEKIKEIPQNAQTKPFKKCRNSKYHKLKNTSAGFQWDHPEKLKHEKGERKDYFPKPKEELP